MTIASLPDNTLLGLKDNSLRQLNLSAVFFERHLVAVAKELALPWGMVGSLGSRKAIGSVVNTLASRPEDLFVFAAMACLSDFAALNCVFDPVVDTVFKVERDHPYRSTLDCHLGELGTIHINTLREIVEVGLLNPLEIIGITAIYRATNNFQALDPKGRRLRAVESIALPFAEGFHRVGTRQTASFTPERWP